MVFWIAILTGVFFVWLAVRLGFYETWALLFNVIISIYVAIFLAPLVTGLAPASPYGVAFSMILLAGGCFAILHGLCYVFLTGQFNIPFPRFFDIFLAGALGFVAGFLILSFVALVITVTPLAEHGLIRSVGFDLQAQGPNLSGLAWCCDRVHAVVGFEKPEHATRAAVQRLLETSQQMAPTTSPEPSDSNEPPETASKPARRSRDPVEELEKL